MPDVFIYTGRKCGWAVRNYCALIEKGIEFQAIPCTDAAGTKLPDFLASSPFGHTPVLIHGETRVFDSVLISEYIEDSFPGPALLPSDADERIESRKWTSFCESGLIGPLGDIARASRNGEAFPEGSPFLSNLGWFIENVMQGRWRGPFFFGEQFSLVDIAFFTYFRVARPLESSFDASAAVFNEQLQAWGNNILARKSIKQAQKLQIDLKF